MIALLDSKESTISSDIQNPYSHVAIETTNPASSDSIPLLRVMSSLATWQYLLASVALFFCGLSIFALIAFVAVGAVGGGVGLSEMLGMLLVAVLAAVIYGIPGLLLWRAAKFSKRYASAPSENHLHSAIAAQNLFWKTSCIIVLIVVAGYLAILVAVMVGAMFMTGFT